MLSDSRLDEAVRQAVCLRAGADVIGFGNQGNAGRVVKRSAIPLAFAANHHRFKRITRSEVILEGDTDAILAPRTSPSSTPPIRIPRPRHWAGLRSAPSQQVKVTAQSFQIRGTSRQRA